MYINKSIRLDRMDVPRCGWEESEMSVSSDGVIAEGNGSDPDEIDLPSLFAERGPLHGLSSDEIWPVIWGFDPGDAFLVFPILLREEGEGAQDWWLRSFETAKKRDEMLSIGSWAVDCLLLEELIRRFDPKIEFNLDPPVVRCDHRFDWYYENGYSLEDCLGMAGTLEQAAETLASVSDATTVRLDGPRVVLRDISDLLADEEDPDRFIARIDAMPAKIARDRVLRMADGIRKVVAAAQEHACDVVTFSGP